MMRDERLSADLGADDGAALALGERGNLIFARLHRQNERFCIMHRIGRETSMDSKLFLEVFQREEGMTGIKTLLIFPVPHFRPGAPSRSRCTTDFCCTFDWHGSRHISLHISVGLPVCHVLCYTLAHEGCGLLSVVLGVVTQL